jgi:Fe-S cluster assembly scaffold protein SufB
MVQLSTNPDVSHYTFREPSSQIDFFHHTKRTLTIHLQDKAALVYAMVLENADVEMTIIAEENAVKAQIFAFLPAKNAAHTSLKVQTVLKASHTAVNVHLIAIQGEGAEVSLQGAIDIAAGVEKVSGHLLEEVVLLGNAKYVSLQPVLNVASPDVQASHGAKVHRVPLEKLFYMQSRGLSLSAALEMIVGAYVGQILRHFELSEEEREQVGEWMS